MHVINEYATPELIVANTDLRKAGHYAQEAIGYSLVWLGQYDRAVAPLEKACEEMREYIQRPIHGEWGEAVLDRIVRFRKTLIANPAKAKAQLERWAAETAERQKLVRYL